MQAKKSVESASHQLADQAIKSTQNLASDTMDTLSNAVDSVRDRVSPMINRASEQASALAQRSIQAVRDGSREIQNRAVRAADSTVIYIKNEPVKSVLIAAAAGAALVAIAGLVNRSRNRDR